MKKTSAKKKKKKKGRLDPNVNRAKTWPIGSMMLYDIRWIYEENPGYRANVETTLTLFGLVIANDGRFVSVLWPKTDGLWMSSQWLHECGSTGNISTYPISTLIKQTIKRAFL